MSAPGPPEPEHLPPGTAVGPWEVVHLLGAGGVCDVYLACGAGGAEAALKVLRPEQDGDPRLGLRFDREGELLLRLEHPNVIRLLGRGHDARLGRRWLALEHIAGLDLGKLLARRGRLSPSQVALVLDQCAAALEAAHALGVLHRDVKAQNVLVTPEGGIKLADFGLALAPALQTRVTARDEVPGTLHYLAPEVLLSSSWSPASDLYALGVLGHLLASGAFPFEGEPKLLVQAHLNQAPPDLALAGVPVALAALIDLLLAKDPRQRPGPADLRLAFEAAQLLS